MMEWLILSSVSLLLAFIPVGQCDPHPHLVRHGHQATNMTDLCNQHKRHLDMSHNHHLFDLKYRTCASQASLDKFKRWYNECLMIMDPKDIGYCLAPENHQSKFEAMKKCFNETKFNEEESQVFHECMGFRRRSERRRKREYRMMILFQIWNVTELCDRNLIMYYLDHPSHFEAHHSCQLVVLGNERVGKRVQCHATFPIKSLDDYNDKCKSPEDHKDEFDAAMACFKENMITPEEKNKIMVCTFSTLQELDNDYVLQALTYKPFADFDEFCIKSRNYHTDEDEIYKDRFEACSMKNYRGKTEARWACETFDKFDQTSVDKCIEKQEEEFKTMITCLANNEYTPEEEEKIKVCLADSQVEWKGVPKVPSSIEEACGYTLLRWFGYNPVYYKFVDECMKEKWSPEEYSKFECANILTIKTHQELTSACKSPTEEHKATYLKFRECREGNEPPKEKIADAFECSVVKMIEHLTELKKAEDEEEESATTA